VPLVKINGDFIKKTLGESQFQKLKDTLTYPLRVFKVKKQEKKAKNYTAC